MCLCVCGGGRGFEVVEERKLGGVRWGVGVGRVRRQWVRLWDAEKDFPFRAPKAVRAKSPPRRGNAGGRASERARGRERDLMEFLHADYSPPPVSAY